jgi:hypothetical protein
MKRIAASFAVAALMAAGLVGAQTSPPPGTSSDRSTYPSTTTSPSSTSPSSSSSTSSAHSKSHKQQMKDCEAAQQASNPSLSKSDIKKACKSQLENSPHE